MGMPGVENSTTDNSLNEVKLPLTLKHIGKAAFSNSFFSSIILPASLETIGELAFQGSRLTKIEIPQSVTDIQAKAFTTCNFLTKAIIRALSSETKVISAENAWFYSCTEGLSIKIPESVNISEQEVFNAYGDFWDYRTSSDRFGWSTIDIEE